MEKQNRNEFVKGRIDIPKPLDGDAYTVAGEALSAEKPKETSTYGVAFRRSPKKAPEFENFAKDDRMVLYGLTDYIRNNLTKPITTKDVDNAEEFMKTSHAFGGPLAFDRTVWDRVVKDYDGFLPLRIDAIPEGSTFFPNEVPVQVTSLDKGFGEISALVEAHLVGTVSNASTRATMERHLLERFKEYAIEDMPNATLDEQIFAAQLMLHDFGMRASSSSEESEILGKAHLLSFPGTDTFNAAYQAYVQNGNERVGSSVLALAHRTVMGFETEEKCFENLKKVAGKGSLASYVADCYNFHKSVSDKLVPMAKVGDATIVARPDSGDYLENILHIVNEAKEAGLYSTQENGRLAMTNLKFIQGDSMNWEKISTVMDTLKKNNYSPVNCGIFGVGGWLRNTPNRDTLSVAYKLMAKGEDLESVVKLSDTRAKMSVPGPVQVLRGQKESEPSIIMNYEIPLSGENIVQTFYDGSIDGDAKFADPCLEKFSTIQNRVIHEFDKAPLEQRILSDEVIRIQDSVMREHGRSLGDYQF